MKLKLSRQNKTGGRPAAVISDQKAMKKGQAISGSRAPSSQSRARVIFDWIGMGRVCCFDTSRVWRTALLALQI